MATRDASAPSIGEVTHGRGAVAAGLGRIGRKLSERLDGWAEAERDQLPLWLPVGLIAGIAAWFSLPDSSHWLAFLLLAGGVALAGFALGAGTRWGRALGWFGLMAALGLALVWGRAEAVAAPRLTHPMGASFAAVVESVDSLPEAGARRLIVAPEDWPAGQEQPARLRIAVPANRAVAGLVPGARIRLRALLLPPPPMAVPGGYDYAENAWFQRIGGSGRALSLNVLSPPENSGPAMLLAGWRQSLSAHIQAALGGGGEGGIAAALATGDQSAIPRGDADAMRAAGLTHLLSVSGLHLTALVGAVMLLTLRLAALSQRLALRRNLVLAAAGAGAVAGLFYTLLTGAEVPTIRSLVAVLIVLGGVALGREALTLRLVATGALIVLLLWPESLAGPSFQLSFAAILAIVALHEAPRVKKWFARRDEAWPLRLGRSLFALILTGLVVELALAPIALFHFHRAGFYGALANLVAIPLTTAVIMPLEALALLFDLVGLGAPFWWLTGEALSLLLGLARDVAGTPGAISLLPAFASAAFALIVGGGLWLALWRTRLRFFGLLPLLAGTTWALATPPPDLIVTGDGRQLVLRGDDGALALLRPGGGDYERDLLAEASGAPPDFRALATMPGAACSPDLCAVSVDRGGRTWHLLLARTTAPLALAELDSACAAADIVVADRILPASCRPRWLRADPALLARSGGLSFYLGGNPGVDSVAAHQGQHPWAVRP